VEGELATAVDFVRGGGSVLLQQAPHVVLELPNIDSLGGGLVPKSGEERRQGEGEKGKGRGRVSPNGDLLNFSLGLEQASCHLDPQPCRRNCREGSSALLRDGDISIKETIITITVNVITIPSSVIPTPTVLVIVLAMVKFLLQSLGGDTRVMGGEDFAPDNVFLFASSEGCWVESCGRRERIQESLGSNCRRGEYTQRESAKVSKTGRGG
jgi:hypothetical protein